MKHYIENLETGEIEEFESKDLPVDKYRILIYIQNVSYGQDSVGYLSNTKFLKNNTDICIESIRDKDGNRTHTVKKMFLNTDGTISRFMIPSHGEWVEIEVWTKY